MEQLLTDHWVAVVAVLSPIGLAISAAVAWVGTKSYNMVVWLGEEVIKPIVKGHLDFVRISIEEARMQSDTLASIDEKTAVQNETLVALVGRLQNLEAQYQEVCRYNEDQKSKHPEQRRGRGDKPCSQ